MIEDTFIRCCVYILIGVPTVCLLLPVLAWLSVILLALFALGCALFLFIWQVTTECIRNFFNRWRQ